MNMNSKANFRLLLLLSAILPLRSFAGQPEMADTMRSEGKIYVLVAIILVILAGVCFYLIRLDRKISRLESEEAEKKHS